MSFNDLGFYSGQDAAEREGCAYIPRPQIASQSFNKDRLNACLGCEFETLALGLLSAATDQPTTELFMIEICSQRAYMPLDSTDAKASD
jgi:hypothetical protein